MFTYPECEGCPHFDEETGVCDWYGQDADAVRQNCD